jgi:hypothetical protein
VEVNVVDIVEMLVESARREDRTNAVRIGYEPVDDCAWKRDMPKPEQGSSARGFGRASFGATHPGGAMMLWL